MMIEILAILYCSCFILSALLLAWNLTSLQKHLKSQELSNLNFNLKKVDRFWSTTNDHFANLNESSIEGDARAARRSCLMMGLLGFASLPGLLLFLTLTVSLKLIKSRRSIAVFRSELVHRTELSTGEVQNLVQNLSEIT